jgi:general secretion pathway protein N
LLTLSFLAGAVASLPASLVAGGIAGASHNSVLLSNSEGTLWNGSAQLALKSSEAEAVLLPGRIRWQVGLGIAGLKVNLGIPAVGGDSQAVRLVLAPVSGYVEAGQLRLPARILMGLGAPFNTLGLEGDLMAQWPAFRWSYATMAPAVPVSSKIEIQGVSTRVTPVSPVGSYEIGIQSGPTGGSFDLTTRSGPLTLLGHGEFQRGHAFHFEGQAFAAANMQGQLNGLLSILGKQEGELTRLHY